MNLQIFTIYMKILKNLIPFKGLFDYIYI